MASNQLALHFKVDGMADHPPIMIERLSGEQYNVAKDKVVIDLPCQLRAELVGPWQGNPDTGLMVVVCSREFVDTSSALVQLGDDLQRARGELTYINSTVHVTDADNWTNTLGHIRFGWDYVQVHIP